MDISDNEKNEKIEKRLKETREIRDKIKERIKQEIKQEIDKIDFLLSVSKIDEIYGLVEKDIEHYSSQITYNIENKKFFHTLLKIVFKELEILVKIRSNDIFNGEYIIFKSNESVLISFLIENFKSNNIIERTYNLYITKTELKEFIEIYKVKDDFIDKLKKYKILTGNRLDEEDIFISFKDSIYTSENEENFRKFLLQKYTLKINKELINDIVKYKENINELKNDTVIIEKNTSKLKKTITIIEKNINNSKIEGITILGIFTGIFSYLSLNFNLAKNLLSHEKVTENIILIAAILCLGLIPIIIILLFIKFLFLMPSDFYLDDDKKLSWNKCLPYSIVMGIFIFLEVMIVLIHMNVKKDYERYNGNLNNLQQQLNLKTEEIQKLENELNNMKLKYKEQEKNFLKQKVENEKDIKMISDLFIEKLEKDRGVKH